MNHGSKHSTLKYIPRPEGNGWKALAYMVAAIGAFSSAAGPGVADITLFHAARTQLSMDDLESGNISLVQALTLMSNYLQKRNKPNSGYNYLGLALRMAMGLGLHKEFPKWDISPLQMEIRRRVWWTLFVFDIGATITFSRPIGWPHEGIEVALPLNVHDRVSA
jgi:transcriptional regulatory protein GAL4